MNQPAFINDYCYHTCNRGVDKREMFLDIEDYQRFLHDMYEFNDTQYAPPFVRRIPKLPREREKLVEIYCYCLMPNHFHLVLKQLRDEGVTLFMKKLCMGYANYFNKKYKRSGALFQGRFKAKTIENDSQMLHLSRYIHVLNPGELVEPDIREGKVRDAERLDLFLKKYRWSSYLDYLGIKNYPSLIQKDFIMGQFKDKGDFEQFSRGWKRGDLEKINDLILDS
jgi:putative transposase